MISMFLVNFFILTIQIKLHCILSLISDDWICKMDYQQLPNSRLRYHDLSSDSQEWEEYTRPNGKKDRLKMTYLIIESKEI